LHINEIYTWKSDSKNWLIIEPSTNTPFQTMRGDISKKLATLAQNPYTKEMIEQLVFNETEMNEQKICQNDSEKDEQS